MYNLYLVADWEVLKEVSDKIRRYEDKFGDDQLVQKMALIDHVLHNEVNFGNYIFDMLIGNTQDNDPFPNQLKDCQAHVQEEVFYYKDLVDRLNREEVEKRRQDDLLDWDSCNYKKDDGNWESDFSDDWDLMTMMEKMFKTEEDLREEVRLQELAVQRWLEYKASIDIYQIKFTVNTLIQACCDRDAGVYLTSEQDMAPQALLLLQQACEKLLKGLIYSRKASIKDYMIDDHIRHNSHDLFCNADQVGELFQNEGEGELVQIVKNIATEIEKIGTERFPKGKSLCIRARYLPQEIASTDQAPFLVFNREHVHEVQHLTAQLFNVCFQLLDPQYTNEMWH